jgi:hypothetical protein
MCAVKAYDKGTELEPGRARNQIPFIPFIQRLLMPQLKIPTIYEIIPVIQITVNNSVLRS